MTHGWVNGPGQSGQSVVSDDREGSPLPFNPCHATLTTTSGGNEPFGHWILYTKPGFEQAFTEVADVVSGLGQLLSP